MIGQFIIDDGNLAVILNLTNEKEPFMKSNDVTLSAKQRRKIDPMVFWPPVMFLGVLLTYSLIDEKSFYSVASGAMNWISTNFGSLILMSLFSFFIFLVVLAVSKYGAIRFGGKEALPDFSYWNWFAMSLCAGIATGILFWGIAEPIYHVASPPASLGLEPNSRGAALFALSTCYLHWTVIPYSTYLICAVPIALAYYNHNQSFTVSSGLYFLIGDRSSTGLGKVINCLCLFAIAGGLAASLGGGVMQIGQGLKAVFGLVPGKMIWLIISMSIVFAYTLSSYTGLEKGIKILSDNNAKAYVLILVLIFLFGPTKFIFDLGIESLGFYLDHFAQKALFTAAATGDQWPSWWTIFYWAFFLAYAPLVGLFLSRLAKGRTLREFIFMNMLAPSIFAVFWFWGFGGTAINFQMTGVVDLMAQIKAQGMEAAIFNIFENFPMGTILMLLFMFCVVISFITIADSMTSCMAAMSTQGMNVQDGEAPSRLKIAWGLIIGVFAYIMIAVAGSQGIKTTAIVTGFPILFIMIAMVASTIKGCVISLEE